MKAGDTVLRVVRGGSFLVDHGGVRAACRLRGSPDYRSHHQGFRVVVAPRLA